MAHTASACERTDWPAPTLKLHVHEGITVEIRPGRPELAVYRSGRLCQNDPTVAGRVIACGGALRALATVAVFLGEESPDPGLIAWAIRETDRVGAERPKGVPADAQLVDLPYSEVCMHMRLAGRLRWVAPLAGDAAQIYDEHGRPFAIPILRGEAGLELRDRNTSNDRPGTRVHPPVAP